MNTTAIRKGIWAALVAAAITISVLVLVNTLLTLMFGLDGARMYRAIMIGTFTIFAVGGLVAGYIAAKHDPGGTVVSGALAAGAFQLIQIVLNALYVATSSIPQTPVAMMLTSIGSAMVVGMLGALIRIFVRTRTSRLTA